MKHIAPDRAAAERQDFMAGAIFAAGAGGLPRENWTGGAEDGEPRDIFFVIVDTDAYTVEPNLEKLFDLHARVGTEALAAQIDGSVAWGIFDDSAQPLAKVEVKVSAPVRINADFLLLAENYSAAWRALTRPHFFALIPKSAVTAEIDLHALLQAGVVFGAPASEAARELGDKHGWLAREDESGTLTTDSDDAGQAADSEVMVIDGDIGLDEVRYATTQNPDTGMAGILFQIAAITSDGSGQDFAANLYIGRGLPAAPIGGAIAEAKDWAIEFTSDEFIISDQAGVPAVSGSLNDVAPEWVAAIERDGFVVVGYGPTESLIAFTTGPVGVVRLRSRVEPTSSSVPEPAQSQPEAEDGREQEAAETAQESWWARLTRWMSGA